MKLTLLALICLLQITANASDKCPTIYSSDLSDEQVLALEQKAIQQGTHSVRFASGANVLFKDCTKEAQSYTNVDAIRERSGQYGMLQTVKGVETAHVYSCDSVSSRGEFKTYFKIKKFEATSRPQTDSFYMHNGCAEFGDSAASATVEVSVR